MIELVEKKNIWVLEDDQMINWIYKEILSPRYNIHIFTNIKDFQTALDTKIKPEMIIVDILLPDGNVINYIKNDLFRISGTPYLVVSADTHLDSLRFCLDDGAVDYLTKPFQVNELLVKVENFLSRYHNQHAEKLKTLNEIFMKNSLTHKESSILNILMKNINCFVSKKEILETVWGKQESIKPKTMDVHLYNLRKKLEPLNFEILSDSAHRLKLM